MKLSTILVIFSSSAESYSYWNSRNSPDCTKSNTGKSCLAWDSGRNNPIKCDGRTAPGGCANPDNDPRGPWCYTGYGTRNHFEYCDPQCSEHNVCATSGGRDPPPVDKCNRTNGGKQCRNWSESVHLSRNRKTKLWMKNQNNSNCANPDNDSRGNWCFIDAPRGAKNYDYCPQNCMTKPEPPTLPPTRPPTRPPPVPAGSSCVPKNEELIQFRDPETGRPRRPTTWDIADEIPYGSLGKIPSILDGKKALNGLIPWQVQLIGPYLCGGTITSPRIVITANHCVAQASNPRQWSVQAGHIEIGNAWGVPDGAQRKRVIKIMEHENYNPRNNNNDISIMVTDSAFEFNDYVKPACLPPRNFKPVGGDCIISGFGHTSQGGRASKDLLWTLIPLMDRQTCSSKLGMRLTDNMICGGGAGPDTCQGDSGGPLVCAYRHPSGEKQYVLVGVTSWGVGCGQTPGVYCEVSDHLDWIDQISSQYN
ncbi:unnamed protein product [Oikopleura dioica]|uniref:Plasminogen n=1 Tax=Oikopleura dioica TaxID=34765 RepID=E4XKE1_OIKDI|nr:unnamed protein product [Oikopleura dioica]